MRFKNCIASAQLCLATLEFRKELKHFDVEVEKKAIRFFHEWFSDEPSPEGDALTETAVRQIYSRRLRETGRPEMVVRAFEKAAWARQKDGLPWLPELY